MKGWLVAVGAAMFALGCEPRLPGDALSDVERISSGAETSCARTRNGATACWGNDRFGDRAINEYATPLKEVGIVSVSLDALSVCIVRADRSVACRGSSDFGVLGIPAPSVKDPWVRELTSVPGLRDVESVGIGSYLACALHRDGSVECWGKYAEPLRAAKHVPDHERTIVTGVPAIAQIALGSSSAIMLDRDGGVWVGGGISRTGVEKVASDVAQVAAGDDFFCARSKTGDVSCWADKMASSYRKVERAPTPVENVHHAIDIAAGMSSACAVVDGGRVMCWGFPVGTSDEKAQQWRVASVASRVDRAKSVALGGAHACAVRDDGHVLCWGQRHRGLLGNGERDDDIKGTGGPDYVRTGTNDTPTATAAPRALAIVIATIAGLLAALAFAFVTDRRAATAWRLHPLPSQATNEGAYRSSDVAGVRAHAPRTVRAACWIGFASLGVDLAFVVVALLYAVIAVGLGLRQHGVSALINIVMGAGLPIIMIAWLARVASTLRRASLAVKPALASLRTFGILGAIGHFLLLLVAWSSTRMLGIILAPHTFESIAPWDGIIAMTLVLAALPGIAAGITLALASRASKTLTS